MTEGNTAYSYPEYDGNYNYDDYNYNDYDYDDYNYNYDGSYEEEKITEPENDTEIIMAEKARSNIQVSRPVVSDTKSGSVFNIILVSVVAAGLLGSVIYALDRRNTVYNNVTEMNKTLSLAEAENVRLQSELESKMSAKNVEDYAENVLGMKKMDSSQIKYIKIQTDDVVTILEQEKGFTAKLKGFFDACVEYFRG